MAGARPGADSSIKWRKSPTARDSFSLASTSGPIQILLIQLLVLVVEVDGLPLDEKLLDLGLAIQPSLSAVGERRCVV